MSLALLNKEFREFLTKNRRDFQDSLEIGEHYEFIFNNFIVEQFPQATAISPEFDFIKIQEGYLQMVESDKGTSTPFITIEFISNKDFEVKIEELKKNIEYYTYKSFFERYY